ncbi:hypothetical protein FVEN_g11745 [Fusarium venenatum]|nr:hypothetical protein FVEN_g11745 [Fusarium venenatum]
MNAGSIDALLAFGRKPIRYFPSTNLEGFESREDPIVNQPPHTSLGSSQGLDSRSSMNDFDTTNSPSSYFGNSNIASTESLQPSLALKSLLAPASLPRDFEVALSSFHIDSC